MNSNGWNNWFGFLLGLLVGYLIFETSVPFLIPSVVTIVGVFVTRELSDRLGND